MKFMTMIAMLMLWPVTAFAGAKEDLIAADKAFAAISVEKGTAAAFLAYITDDARLFGVGGEPVIGRKAAEDKYKTQETKNKKGAARSTLNWEPTEAFASTDGTLGWTNGHWTYTSAPDAKGESTSSTGHYVTIWRRDKSGAWKVEADIGTTDPEPKPK